MFSRRLVITVAIILLILSALTASSIIVDLSSALALAIFFATVSNKNKYAIPTAAVRTRATLPKISQQPNKLTVESINPAITVPGPINNFRLEVAPNPTKLAVTSFN
jgi:hypothetical protein